MWKLSDERSLLKMRVLSRAVKGPTANAALQLDDMEDIASGESVRHLQIARACLSMTCIYLA